MKEGDAILTPVPHADGSIKNRPAIVLPEMPRCYYLLVCGVGTQLHQHVEEFDEIVSPGDPDFAGSGLLSESLISLGFWAVLSRKSIAGSIGAISSERHEDC